MADYVKNVDLLVSNVESEEEAEEAFARSGITDGALIGEALVYSTEPAEEV